MQSDKEGEQTRLAYISGLLVSPDVHPVDTLHKESIYDSNEKWHADV